MSVFGCLNSRFSKISIAGCFFISTDLHDTPQKSPVSAWACKMFCSVENVRLECEAIHDFTFSSLNAFPFLIKTGQLCKAYI